MTENAPSTAPVDTPPAGASVEDMLAAAARLHRAGRLDDAEKVLNRILNAQPRRPAALHLMGLVRLGRGQINEAITLVEQAVAGAPRVPAFLVSLSMLYRRAEQPDAALKVAQRAVTTAPREARAYLALGLAQMEHHHVAEAAQALARSLSIDPENPVVHLELAHALLLQGEFRPGWLEYEWRYRVPEAAGTVPKFKIPSWNGMALPEGRILLVGDQGYGDTIQFARYIPAVAKLCGEVLLGCSQELRALLTPIPGVGRSFDRWQDVPAAGCYSTLSSLPRLLGTMPDSIPNEVPYLAADAAAVERWAGRLPARDQGLRVGYAWSGRPSHPRDLQRSVPLSELNAALGVNGTINVSLQKPVPAPDRGAGMPEKLLDFSKDLTDFSETAALISNLDLVVTVDTSVAHLAGALGKPVWVMLPWLPDWRWMLDREDSPWYPTARLFRQGPARRWHEVVKRVADELTALAQSKSGSE